MSRNNSGKTLDATTLEVKDNVVQNIQPQSETDSHLVGTIKERFRLMKHHRETSCVTNIGNIEKITSNEAIDDTNGTRTTSRISTGYSWDELWKRCYALYGMKTKNNNVYADLNEVCSPIVFSTVQAVVAQFMDANTKGTYVPMAGVNEYMARFAEFWQENWENKTNAQKLFKEACFREAMICGSAITHNCHIRKVRTVNMMLSPKEVLVEYVKSITDPAFFENNRKEITSNPEQFIDDVALETLKTNIEENPKKYLSVEKEIVDFDDVYAEVVPIEEFYVDPTALNLNGVSRDARDCIWITQIPYQEFINTYKDSDDPFMVKSNINTKVLFAPKDYDVYKINDTYDDTLHDTVTLLKYYNKYTDKYVILANDIVIRKGPLPYNHKLLPFSIYKCIPVKNSFYGVGLATLLDNVQTRDEFYTAIQDYITLMNSNTPGTYTDNGDMNTVLQEIAEDQKPLKAGQWIKIGPNDRLERMPPINDNGDIARRRAELQETATRISMVSPLLLNQMMTNTAVRNNQMMQENSLMGIRMLINTWSEGLEDTLFQLLHLVKQVSSYSYSSARDSMLSRQDTMRERIRSMRSITINGYKVEADEGDLRLVPDQKGQEFELTDDIVDSFDKLRVHINIETSALASKALQAQELQDTMGLVLNIMSNPALSDNKLVTELLKQYLVKKNMDSKVIEYFSDDDSAVADELALYQNEKMKQGEEEPPIPGMSDNHCMIHAQLLMELVVQREQLMLEAEASGDQQAAIIAEQLTQIIRNVQKHLAGDQMARMNTNQVAITMSGEQQPPQTPVDNTAQMMNEPDAGALAQQDPMMGLPPQGG